MTGFWLCQRRRIVCRPVVYCVTAALCTLLQTAKLVWIHWSSLCKAIIDYICNPSYGAGSWWKFNPSYYSYVYRCLEYAPGFWVSSCGIGRVFRLQKTIIFRIMCGEGYIGPNVSFCFSSKTVVPAWYLYTTGTVVILNNTDSCSIINQSTDKTLGKGVTWFIWFKRWHSHLGPPLLHSAAL